MSRLGNDQHNSLLKVQGRRVAVRSDDLSAAGGALLVIEVVKRRPRAPLDEVAPLRQRNRARKRGGDGAHGGKSGGAELGDAFLRVRCSTAHRAFSAGKKG